MSDWTYVAIAYTLVWGALAVYAVVLVRRISQAREVARQLRQTLDTERHVREQDSVICDAPPAP